MRWVVLALGLAGCYTGAARTTTRAEVEREVGWTRVTDVPFVAQRSQKDCGAAALAMVAGYWGVSLTLDEIAAAHPGRQERGLTAGELRDLARARGLHAYVVRGEPADLRAEIERGRPLIVGLAKPYGRQRVQHFEVLVGLDGPGRRVLSLDPAQGWRENSLQGFAEEWGPAQQILLVVFPADRRGGGARSPGSE